MIQYLFCFSFIVVDSFLDVCCQRRQQQQQQQQQQRRYDVVGSSFEIADDEKVDGDETYRIDDGKSGRNSEKFDS